MHTGKIKFFNTEKGYGFITPDDRAVNNGSDVFVHARDLIASGVDAVHEGQAVGFELDAHKGKVHAKNIKV